MSVNSTFCDAKYDMNRTDYHNNQRTWLWLLDYPQFSPWQPILKLISNLIYKLLWLLNNSIQASARQNINKTETHKNSGSCWPSHIILQLYPRGQLNYIVVYIGFQNGEGISIIRTKSNTFQHFKLQIVCTVTYMMRAALLSDCKMIVPNCQMRFLFLFLFSFVSASAGPTFEPVVRQSGTYSDSSIRPLSFKSSNIQEALEHLFALNRAKLKDQNNLHHFNLSLHYFHWILNIEIYKFSNLKFRFSLEYDYCDNIELDALNHIFYFYGFKFHTSIFKRRLHMSLVTKILNCALEWLPLLVSCWNFPSN